MSESEGTIAGQTAADPGRADQGSADRRTAGRRTIDQEIADQGTADQATIADLKALVAELVNRVQTLEKQAAEREPEVSEEVLLAIAAACAAYLGKRATVKQVHLTRGSTWATQGRQAQQGHAVIMR